LRKNEVIANKEKTNFITPFSPTIMETNVPQKFIDIVNKIGDEVLVDDKKSAQWDWSNHLVGKVHKEVQIPIVNKVDGDYCKLILKDRCLTYLKEMINKGRGYIDNKILHHPVHGNLHPTDANISISQSWIVSQYKGEYNPWHQHSGHLSAVIYLKVPKDMNKFYDKESEDHYPVGGAIQFMQGDKQNLRNDTLTFRPEVGKMLVFPSWLKHSVYPFDIDGERRSMSFNAYYVDKK
tara:strand:+ start:170 stop:877 length:708 start_codon:yes stop_codon:yes gene_type:complete